MLAALYSYCSLVALMISLHAATPFTCNAFLVPQFQPLGPLVVRRRTIVRRASRVEQQEAGDDAERMKQQAKELREQIRKMEEELGDQRRNRQLNGPTQPNKLEPNDRQGMTLRGKRVFIAGANGRLGSMVCRHLLRNHPHTQVVAAVHVVGENSPTSRGYGRLSYEVGAEDGIGRIGAAWSAEDRTATFQWDEESMRDYNLHNLRVVECELLDPVQCMSVAEGCDSVIWCATDFNGNQPRAISTLNVAFLFRAVARPDKGRVEIEGLQNMLGALKNAKQDKKWRSGEKKTASNDPISVVLVSTAPDAYDDFETPLGTFNGLKRQGEIMLKNDFPSLTSTVMQLCRFEDNFVEEGLEILQEDSSMSHEVAERERARRRINRRDAAKAVVEALVDETIAGKTVQVWTATR